MMRSKLPQYVYLYFVCQSINLMSAVISVVVAATVGELIALSPIYSTIPYGTQFLFLLLGTYPAAILMKKTSRNFGFICGALFLALAGALGYFAVSQENFFLLIMAHGCIGLFTSFANYYRFAVTDNLSESLKSKALSLVVAGGVIAGILGPLVTITLQDIDGFPKFSLCYAFLIFIALVNIVIICFLPKGYKQISSHKKAKQLNNDQIYLANKKKSIDPRLYLAILAASLGYGLMNLLMIQSSLQMNHFHVSFNASALAIQWHVVAMFFPSFFTGILINRIGHSAVINVGLLLFIISFIINITTTNYIGMSLSLIILGIAWNFSYVGGSSLLTKSIDNSNNKQKWQGVCDTVIALIATCGAMFPSILFNTLGWQNTNIVAALIATIPMLFFIVHRKLGRT